jgi:hypothetical protein
VTAVCPGRSDDTSKQVTAGGRRSIDQFLTQAAAARTPATRATHRLIFAIDATASRQPTWDLACELHAELFSEAARLGNIAIQLCYYRGIGEFAASPWTTTPAQLRDEMGVVSCRGGRTQLVRLLRHAAEQAAQHPLRGLIFIGDCFEEDETVALRSAGALALRGVPVFVFQEGRDRRADRAFADIARVTRGAHVPFDGDSAQELRRLLGAVAQYAVGGLPALADYARRHGSEVTRALLSQLSDR